MAENGNLDYLFRPGSIAIAGVASDVMRLGGGRGFLESLVGIGFKGRIFPINREDFLWACQVLGMGKSWDFV